MVNNFKMNILNGVFFPNYGRSVRWLGNTKETTNFDDLLDGIDIKVLYRVDQHF